MKHFNIFQGRHFLLAIAGLLLCTLSLYAQDGFVVRNPCMTNPDCNSDGTTFEDTVGKAVAWNWSFGDGGSSQLRSVLHSFQMPGPQTVTLIRTLTDGTSQTVSQSITVGELPQPLQNWKSDTTICPGETITIDPYPNGGAPAGATFFWYPKGNTTQALTIDSSGCYSVEIILPNGCKIQELLNVKICLEQTGQEGAKWFFGANAGLDFSGAPDPISDGKLNTAEGTSVISNSKGKLLFYSDGITVYDANHGEMRCVEDKNKYPYVLTDCKEKLKGDQNTAQTVLIVPQPTCKGCEYLFNVFTTNAVTNELNVSVVDMRGNNGQGAIIEQNRLLNRTSSEKLVSVRNDADSTYWVVSHDAGSNTFRVYHATEGGLVESNTFSLGMNHDANSAESYMKFSAADSTGNRTLAVLVPGPPNNHVELFSFNDEDGTLSLQKSINLGPAPPTAYGVEFSPDSQKLYISYRGNATAYSRLEQYDLSLGSDSLVMASKLTLDSLRGDSFGALQIAPDGKIYMAIKGSEHLAVIGEPDQVLLSRMEYEREGQSLGGKKSQLGLPNFVQNFTNEQDGPGFQAEGFCTNEPTTFQASPLCQPIEDSYSWDFGDGATASGKETEVSHTYLKPGIYTVLLRASNKCKDTTFTQRIEIFETPLNLDLGPDKDTCTNVVTLTSPIEAKHYQWRNLSTRRIISREKTANVPAPGGDIQLIIWNDPDGECITADTVRLNLRRPPFFSLGPDTTVCLNGSIELTANGQGWREFKWNTGETSRMITVTQPGTYSVIVKDGNECVNGDTIQVSERPKARITAILTGPTGCTTADGRILVTNVNPPGSYNFTWMTIDGTLLNIDPQLTALDNLREGAYILRVSGNPLICTTDTTLHLRSPANNLNMSPLIRNASCSDPASGSIRINVTGGNPTVFTWRNSSGVVVSTADSASNLIPGSYSLEAADAGGCTFSITGILVGLDKDNLADLGPDIGKCKDDAVELSPKAVNFPATTFLWSTGSTDRTITVSEDGIYSVTVKNTEYGCEATDEIRVFSTPAPQVTLAPEFGLCVDQGGSVILTAYSREKLSYFWPHSNETTASVTVSRIGTYTVEATGAAGCTIEKSTEVKDKCEPYIRIPDAFSPNNDNINDVLDVFGQYFTHFDIKIYSRWGEVIFNSESIENRWNGKYRDQLVQPGVYAYIASYRSRDYPERPAVILRGSVTVTR